MIGRLGKALHALLGRDAEAAPEARRDWLGWNRQLRANMHFTAAYEAAIRRPDLWTLADFRDADASLLPEKRRIIRSHSRYEQMNNPVVCRIMNVWCADVVGEYGPTKQHHTGFTDLDRFLDRLWARWWECARMVTKLRTAVRAEAGDGEAGGLIISNPRVARWQPLQLDVRLFETDRLASPNWENANRSDYVDGVHLDPYTQEPTAYDLLKAHPGTEYLDQLGEQFEADTIDRSHVLHAFRQHRPEQHRGVCRFAPVMGFAGNLRKFMDSDVAREALRAAFLAVLKSTAGGDDDTANAGTDETPTEDQWWQQISLPNRSGALMMLPEGYEPSQLTTDSGGSSLDIYHRIIGGLIAGCFVMPTGRALGKQDGASYPGVRSDMEPYHKTIASDRGEIWEPFWLMPLHDQFLIEASLLEEFREIMERVPEETRLDLNNVEWSWPNKELVVDPSREETARKSRFSMGITDRERESPYNDLEEADARNAALWGFDDVKQYRQALFHATVGIPVGSVPPAAGDATGEFGGLGRRQFTNNRKAIRDILTDFMDGQATEGATLQMLQALGLPAARAQALIDDARDKSIDDPELAEDEGAQPPA